jgi:glycerophosphoryl diester phosphodiesterase
MTTPAPRLVAHGGASARAPEHTIPAYEAAVAAGADLLLPVRLSADDQLVVIRDAGLERTTDGRGRVREHTLRALKRLDAGRWLGRAFRGQRIQTLSEVIERFRDRAGFVVELPGPSDADAGIEERLVGLLAVCGASDRTLAASFDHHALRRVRELDPETRLVARVTGRLLAPEALAPPGLLTGLWVDAALTTDADVAAIRAAGLECYVGTVNEPVAARRLAAAGATSLVTERPDLLRTLW